MLWFLISFAFLASKTSKLHKLRKKESSCAKARGETEWAQEEQNYMIGECQWALTAVSELDAHHIVETSTNHKTLQLKLKEFRIRVEAVIQGVVRSSDMQHHMLWFSWFAQRKEQGNHMHYLSSFYLTDGYKTVYWDTFQTSWRYRWNSEAWKLLVWVIHSFHSQWWSL